MKWVFVFICLLTFVVYGKNNSIDKNPFLTRIQRSRIKKEEPQNIYQSLSTVPLAATDQTNVLQQLPGITFTQQGGPLVPTDMKIRGLSGARLSAELEGINLVDPISGLIDIHDLPFFVSDNAQLALGANDSSISGKLTLQFPQIKKPLLISRIGFGSLQTGRSELIYGYPLQKNWDFLLATQGMTTAGNFLFQPSSIVTNTPTSALMERGNNDQNHWTGLVKVSETFGQIKGSTFLFAKLHEGGTAGLAMAPLQYLRASHRYLTGIQKARFTAVDLQWDMQGQSRFDVREAWQKNDLSSLSKVSFVSTEFSLSATGLYKKKPSLFTLTTTGELTRLLDSFIQRQGLGLQLKIKNQLSFAIPMTVQWMIGFRLLNQVGVMPYALFNFSLKPDQDLLFGVRVSHASRAPTFIELYAPRGFVVGDPNLKPESNHEVELYGSWERDSHLQIKLSGFYSFLRDGIFYFNKNAFEISPINTDGVHRLGLETKLHFSLAKEIAFDGNIAMLSTQLLSTRQPLPNIPFLSSTLTLRLGEPTKMSGLVKMHCRTQSSGNFFGTLVTPGYVLLDAFLKVPIFTNSNLHFSITNIFNNLNARDSYQLPLPGRTFFILLELIS